jgi:hypothetical protein
VPRAIITRKGSDTMSEYDFFTSRRPEPMGRVERILLSLARIFRRK